MGLKRYHDKVFLLLLFSFKKSKDVQIFVGQNADTRKHQVM